MTGSLKCLGLNQPSRPSKPLSGSSSIPSSFRPKRSNLSEPRAQLNSTLKKILKPVASLYLTVALLVMAMVLIYAGTTVQKTMGIQDVQKQFFHSWISWIPLDPALRPFAPAGETVIPGGFPFVGGYTLIALLLINLLAAHSVRFKINWKRSGIIAIHLGLIIMLSGELLTSFTSVESQMAISQRQTVQY